LLRRVFPAAALSLEALGGFRVTSARSGTEGVRKALEDAPDAILLDVMMPGLDGPGTVEKLRADPRTSGIPVVLLTAKTQAKDHRQFQAFGVTEVLTKPFDLVALPGSLEAILESATW